MYTNCFFDAKAYTLERHKDKQTNTILFFKGTVSSHHLCYIIILPWLVPRQIKKNEQQQTNKHKKQFVDKYNDKYMVWDKDKDRQR